MGFWYSGSIAIMVSAMIIVSAIGYEAVSTARDIESAAFKVSSELTTMKSDTRISVINVTYRDINDSMPPSPDIHGKLLYVLAQNTGMTTIYIPQDTTKVKDYIHFFLNGTLIDNHIVYARLVHNQTEFKPGGVWNPGEYFYFAFNYDNVSNEDIVVITLSNGYKTFGVVSINGINSTGAHTYVIYEKTNEGGVSNVSPFHHDGNITIYAPMLLDMSSNEPYWLDQFKWDYRNDIPSDTPENSTPVYGWWDTNLSKDSDGDGNSTNDKDVTELTYHHTFDNPYDKNGDGFVDPYNIMFNARDSDNFTTSLNITIWVLDDTPPSLTGTNITAKKINGTPITLGTANTSGIASNNMVYWSADNVFSDNLKSEEQMSYAWDLNGDGIIDTNFSAYNRDNVPFFYNDSYIGMVTVTCWASDNVTGHYTKSSVILRIRDETPPVAKFATSTSLLPEGYVVYMDASSSTDNNDSYTRMSYSFSSSILPSQTFGGGYFVGYRFSGISSGDTVRPITITLNVTDRSGNYDVVQKSITIEDISPPTVLSAEIVSSGNSTSHKAVLSQSGGDQIDRITITVNDDHSDVVYYLFRLDPDGGNPNEKYPTAGNPDDTLTVGVAKDFNIPFNFYTAKGIGKYYPEFWFWDKNGNVNVYVFEVDVVA